MSDCLFRNAFTVDLFSVIIIIFLSFVLFDGGMNSDIKNSKNYIMGLMAGKCRNQNAGNMR